MPSLTISADQPIREASVWVADSLDRDFRDDHWAAQPAKVEAEKTVRANLKAPDSGYRAFFGEILLTAPDGHSFKLSTEARVSPDGVE
jgi:PhoPQ-activated pathogenicity-related protein